MSLFNSKKIIPKETRRDEPEQIAQYFDIGLTPREIQLERKFRMKELALAKKILEEERKTKDTKEKRESASKIKL